MGEEKKLKEECRLALEEERLLKDKKDEECAIIYMNPTTMDATSNKFWKLTHKKFITQMKVFVRNGGKGRVDNRGAQRGDDGGALGDDGGGDRGVGGRGLGGGLDSFMFELILNAFGWARSKTQ